MLTDVHVHNENDILTVLFKFETIYAIKIAMKAGMPILGWELPQRVHALHKSKNSKTNTDIWVT